MKWAYVLLAAVFIALGLWQGWSRLDWAGLVFIAIIWAAQLKIDGLKDRVKELEERVRELMEAKDRSR
jgi:hypothetical protein